MHFALTMPQASAVTANQASMEMDASVCLMVRSWPFFVLCCAHWLSLHIKAALLCAFCAAHPGAPQRVSGKVSGTVYVGSTPVSLNNIDLHAYIVVGDGRAYTAISEVQPEKQPH